MSEAWEENDSVVTGRRAGRPRKGDKPRVPYDQLDKILVYGEIGQDEHGNNTLVFPSYRELALRYGVSHSLISQYAKKKNIKRRREEAQNRIQVQAEQKLVAARSDALALGKEEELRIIDAYLAGFEKAIEEGRVRFDNPSDFNTMLRLKRFIEGGADSRSEVHTTLSLEDLQGRHQQAMRDARVVSVEESGVVEENDKLAGGGGVVTGELPAGEKETTQEPEADEDEAQAPEPGFHRDSGPPYPVATTDPPPTFSTEQPAEMHGQFDGELPDDDPSLTGMQP